MEVYACKFFDLGFHSVELIELVCTKEEVAKFDWMKRVRRAGCGCAVGLNTW
jgi:hypothetical protein